jgi:transposase
MAYIKVIKNREGKEYVYLLEGYRENGKVKTRRLESFGKLEDLQSKEPDILARLKKEASEGKINKDDEFLNVCIDLNKPIDYSDLSYGWLILDDIYKNLGISKLISNKLKDQKSEYCLNEVLKLLVYQRTLDPTSKIGTFRSQNNLYGNWNVTKNSIFRSLKQLNSLKDDIQSVVHESICKSVGRQATLVFYDVTNYYFEMDYAKDDYEDEKGELVSPLPKLGPSKEKRKKPIVQMGLFMDTNGIPISYRLFPGNQTDPITYIPAIEQVKKQFNLERIVVVADKAMNSKDNIIATTDNGDGYVFSIKHRGRRGSSKEIQDFILDENDWQFNHNLTFAKKSMIRERVLVTGTKKREAVKVKEKILVTWSEKYDIREKIRRNGALDYASKLTDAELFRQTSKRGGKRYLDLHSYDPKTGEKLPFSPLITINEEEVEFDAQFDGVNVITTSEIDMSDEEILDSYGELYKIEDCFKVTKTELEGRPCYVWTDESIQGHFLTCYLSLVLIRIIQYVTEHSFSPARIIGALISCRANELKNGYYRVQANEDMISLNDKLGIEWNKAHIKTEMLNKYGNGWFPTKIKQN